MYGGKIWGSGCGTLGPSVADKRKWRETPSIEKKKRLFTGLVLTNLVRRSLMVISNLQTDTSEIWSQALLYYQFTCKTENNQTGSH